MENPKDALTNLYKIEGVSSVKWTTYVNLGDEEAIFKDHERDFEVLLAAEFDLRRDGYIVLADALEERLWLFETSALTHLRDTGGIDGAARVVRVVERYRLQKKSSGLFNARDLLDRSNAFHQDEQLRKRKRSMEEAYPHLKASNSRAVMLNSLIMSQGPNTNENAKPTTVKGDEDPRSMYTSFATSLIITLSYLLTVNRKFVPVGPGVLLRGDFLELDIFNPLSAAETLSPARMISLLALNLQSNGDLLVLFYPYAQRSTVPSKHPLERADVLLAPFGWGGVLQSSSPYSLSSKLDEEHHMAMLPRDWRRGCLNLLRQRGILLSEDIDWVTVDLDYHPISFAAPIRIEWPANLCYQPSKKRKYEDFGRFHNLGDITKLVDPLSAAEDWFLNSAVREKLAQEQIRAQDQKGRKEHENISEEEEIPPGIQTNIGEFNELHNAAGIYPTPPDGSKTQAVSTTTHRTKPISDPINSQQAADEDLSEELKDREAYFDPPSTADIGLGTYDHLEDDDLFGDAQNQMYTDHGITEDDFSFFDRPDEDLFIAQGRDYLPSAPARILESDTQREGEGDMLFVASPETADTDVHSKLESSARHEPTNPKFPNPHESPNQRVPSHGPTAVQTLKSTTLQSHRNEETPEKKKLLEAKPVVMDDKYTTSGKFAPSPMDYPSSSKPDIAPIVTTGIPSIGMLYQKVNRKQTLLIANRTDLNQDLVESPPTSNPSSTSFAENRETLRKDTAHENSLELDDNIAFVKRAQRTFVMRSNSVTSAALIPVKALFESENFLTDNMSRLGPAPGKKEAPEEEHRSMEFIQLAQIFADQFVYYGSLSHSQDNHGSVEDDETAAIESALANAIDSLFSKSCRCTLTELADLGTISRHPESIEQSSIQSTSRKSENNKAAQLIEKPSASTKLLQPPDVLVKRGETLMDISSTALKFWKELGLRPVEGPKNVTAFCLCPDIPMLRRGAKMLLDAVGQTYMSLRLGTHSTGHSLLKAYASGLVTFPADENASKRTEVIDSICEQFGNSTALISKRSLTGSGKSLSALASSETTILIYMIGLSEKEQSIWKLSELFQHIFAAYAANVRTVENPSDLVLQVVPFDWVGSESRIAIPSLGPCNKLAKIIYDKCPLPSRAKSPFASSSAIQISQQLPKSINFKVTTSSSYSPLDYAPVAHLGYVWNEGSSWLSAALVNDFGNQQWSASYYIGQVSNPWPYFVAITNEIWEIVGEAIDFTQDECKVYIAKLEPIKKAEMQVWTKLATDSKVKVCFANVDENPPVRLFDKASGISVNGLDHESMTLLETSEVASPDTNIPKSLEEDDPNARLVDIDERRWSVVLPCALSATSRFLEIDRQASCGYIVGKGKVMFSVGLMQDSNMYNLEELLSKYHALSLLSRARCLNSELPWHLTVSKKAHAGLEAAMDETDT